MKIARITTALFATSLLALTAMGCDGAAQDDTTSTSTQALTAELSSDSPKATFDVVFEISEPTARVVQAFDRAMAPEAERFEAVVDSVGTVGAITDASDVAKMFSAAVQAVTEDNEYVGEREASDAADAPIYAEIPSFSCGNIFPCIVRLQVVFERHDFSQDEAIVVDWSAWAGTGSHTIQIIEVVNAMNR